MRHKILLITGLIVIGAGAAAYIVYNRIEGLRFEQVSDVSTTNPSNIRVLQNTSSESDAPHQSIVVNTNTNQETGSQDDVTSEIETWMRAQQEDFDTRMTARQKQIEEQQFQPQEPSQQSGTSLTASEKTSILVSVNALMEEYDVLFTVTQNLPNDLAPLASTTPAKESIGAINQYVGAYKQAAAKFQNLANSAHSSIAGDFRALATYSSGVSLALKDMQSAATTRNYSTKPFLDFNDSSAGMVKTLIHIAETVRDLAIPVPEDTPTYNLLRMAGVVY